jgi:mRNA interferase MazF
MRLRRCPGAGVVFDAGDIVWLEFGSPFGHEQAGRRPALVVSPRSYNERSSLILVCPITRNASPWFFKVGIVDPGRITGAVLVDQVRSIDYVERYAQRAETVSSVTLDRVFGMFAAMFGIPVAR